ncbi:MAG TPA: peptidylprolyl isomerase [Anaerolineaceae bacterium]|nr:peptidylprolyl isomerase [Anaerolineaceae bacterium]
MVFRIPRIILLISLLLLLSACGTKATASIVLPQPSATITVTAFQPGPTSTPLAPTPTPEPLAILVNGESISLAEYNAELQRFQASLKDTGKTIAAGDAQKQVVSNLVDETLLAQAAFKGGLDLDDAAVAKRITDLTTQVGGSQAFSDWMKKNFYSDDSLKVALRRSIAAAWQRDHVTSTAPTTADQVHARQMLFLDPDTADRYYQQLKAGADFATLAFAVDPDTGGDLGWFPKGYLVLPEIETAAFALQPGQFSQVIKTTYGYQIIFVQERDSQHPLSADARRLIQQQLLENWLKDQNAQSKIEILVPSQ